MKFHMLALVALAVLAVPSAMAGVDYPKEKYDATYEMKGPQGVTISRQVSDGAGKMASETEARGMKSSAILDYKAMTSTSIVNLTKTAYRVKLPPTAAYSDESTVTKKKGYKSLGSKTVAGHPCHGYEIVADGSKTETWVGDDIKIAVQSTSELKGGIKTSMVLKSYKASAPEDIFKIPAGYKIVDQ